MQEDIGDFIDCAQPTASMMDFWISPSMMHLTTWCSIHDVDMGEYTYVWYQIRLLD